jgi:hypothetical protein
LWWAIKNVGNTPAKLLETKARFCVVDASSDEDIPVIPDYGAPVMLNDRFLAPQDSIGYFAKWETWRDGEFVPFEFPADNRLWAILAFGYVKYVDAFGEVRESRSCDVSMIGLNKIADGYHPNPLAPAAYNRCT